MKQGSKLALLTLPALLALLALPAQAHRASVTVQSPRHSFNFQRDWLMKTGEQAGASEAAYNDKGWDKVSLPHAFNETEAFATDIHVQSAGITWYRKRFKLPAGARAANAMIKFEGVRQAAEVWVNGVRVGLNENGIMAFGFDIGKALGPGENVIAVRVDSDWKYKERSSNSAFQWADRNFNANYGGINRPVAGPDPGDAGGRFGRRRQGPALGAAGRGDARRGDL